MPSKRRTIVDDLGNFGGKLVTPGDVCTERSNYMRGHGTYGTKDEEDKRIIASVAGLVEPINKLICVKPFKCRYNGEVGDVIVGRIKEVQQKRWKVDTSSRLDSRLDLSNINLKGGELRKRTAADQFAMREYLKEGDLISAEVQNVHQDGSLSLHTRSLRYGKLGQGVLLKVAPSLVKRQKNHLIHLNAQYSQVNIILGNNGFVWISPPVSKENTGDGGFELDKSLVSIEDREVMCRVRNVITNCLAPHSVYLYDTSVQYAYEASLDYEPKDILKEEVAEEIKEKTLVQIQRLKNGQ